MIERQIEIGSVVMTAIDEFTPLPLVDDDLTRYVAVDAEGNLHLVVSYTIRPENGFHFISRARLP